MMLLSLARAIPRGQRRRPHPRGTTRARTTMPAVGGGGGGGDGRVGLGERNNDRSSSSLLCIVAFVAVDGDVSLSLLRRGPGQAREWQSEMPRRHKRWRRRWMRGVSVTRGKWRHDDATTSRTTDERGVAATQQSTKKKGGKDALVVTAGGGGVTAHLVASAPQ
jgi:hypothetical protein